MLLSVKICFRETARTKRADVIMMNFVKFSPMRLYHFSLSSEKCGGYLFFTPSSAKSILRKSSQVYCLLEFCQTDV